MPQSIENKVISRIYGRGRGWAFTKTDFVAEFGEVNIHRALSSLTKAGKIRRVCRGVYDYPRYSELLDRQLSPDLDQMAHALARKFNWRIQPSGDAALNLLGLSTQVAGRWIYLSDGPGREYEIGEHSLVFKKSALKDVGLKYRESGLVVQALKALGREHVDQKVVERIRQQLTEVRSGVLTMIRRGCWSNHSGKRLVPYNVTHINKNHEIGGDHAKETRITSCCTQRRRRMGRQKRRSDP